MALSDRPETCLKRTAWLQIRDRQKEREPETESEARFKTGSDRDSGGSLYESVAES